MTISIKLENRHLFFLGAIVLAAAAVQLSLGATGTTPVNPGHPLSQTWIDTDLNMSTRNILVGGGVVNISYPGAGRTPLATWGDDPIGGNSIGVGKWFLAQGNGGTIDSGRAWLQYGSPGAPYLVLEDYDDPPRIQFQQVGSGTEAAPQYSGWIGMARTLSNDTAIMGGNVGIGTTNPARTLQVNGNVLFNGTQEGVNTISIPASDIDVGGSIDNIFAFRHTGTATYPKIIRFLGSNALGNDKNPGALTINISSSRIGINANNPMATLDVNGSVAIGSGAATPGRALCWRADKTIGYCSTQPDAAGACTCNAIN